MKIGIVLGTANSNRLDMLNEIIRNALSSSDNEVICFNQNKEDAFSYPQIALQISVLIASNALDYVITGCSSGQGMMLACNSMPSLLCGLIKDPMDAYLFGRINNGNVISFPLREGFGWKDEENIKACIHELFDEPMGIGYPAEDAERKRRDAAQVWNMNQICKKDIIACIQDMDPSFVKYSMSHSDMYSYFIKEGQNEKLKKIIQDILNDQY